MSGQSQRCLSVPPALFPPVALPPKLYLVVVPEVRGLFSKILKQSCSIGMNCSAKTITARSACLSLAGAWVFGRKILGVEAKGPLPSFVAVRQKF